MGAYVSVDGVAVGVVKDQFLRYSCVTTHTCCMPPARVTHIHVPARFSIKAVLAQQTSKQHVLNVTFPANNVGIDCEGRFMACTGGWDWAPYSDTYDQHHAHTFSRGIWKSVYLTTVPSGGAAMTHVVPHVYVQELGCCLLCHCG